MQHPAIVRRLDTFAFRVEPPSDAAPSLAVHDDAGNVAVRWHTVPDRQTLGQILNLLDGALPYLDNSDAYDAPLAALALGNEARGRTLLEELQSASDAEARELATLWLSKLDERKKKDPNHAATMTRLSKSGATPRVRFEARIAMAQLHAANDRVGDAITAVDSAAESARTADERKVALLMRQQFEERRTSILGLGRARELIVGRRTLQPRAAPKSTARVEVRLDGKLAATAKRAPFATTINFGRIPKRQVVELTAKDRGGNVVQRTSAVVNERSTVASIEIAEDAGVVSASVRAPRGTVVDAVLFEWNGATLARFTKPPYRAPLNVRDEVGVLRAVARFDDGTETEDALLLNAGAPLTSDVHIVEVPVYFEAQVPAARDLTIREGGQSRKVERVVSAAETPARVALILDASLSMGPNLLDLQEAALRFVEDNLDARDETMIVGFGASLDILRPTRDRDAIERAVLRLRAAGATPLHDAMLRALLELQAGGSRRALVVFSDGMDTSSVLRAADVQEVARRVGVPIYFLSFMETVRFESPGPGRKAVLPVNVQQIDRAQRELTSLTEKSGGRVFRLESLDGLSHIWNEIGADLRKQSLVLFRTSAGAADEWRTLEISAKGSALRAPAGVFVTGGGTE
jgi:VWFA-related protein